MQYICRFKQTIHLFKPSQILSFLLLNLIFFTVSVIGQSSEKTKLISTSDFVFIDTKPNKNEVELKWSLSSHFYANNDLENFTICIRYAIETEIKGVKTGLTEGEWAVIENIPIDKNIYTIDGLKSDEKYICNVGVKSGNEIIWSSPVKFTTEGSWGLLGIFMLIGSVGLFLFGMKVMSEGIQKFAGQKIRAILNSVTSNPFKGITTGFITTTIVQSSSATSVMVVSFVNAGLLNLRQAFSLIMGANIGTTVTSWLIVIFGFGNFSISSFSLPLFALAIPFIFSVKSLRKSIGEFIIGFALLFMGLEFLQQSIPDLTKQPQVLELIHSWSGEGIQFVLIAILIGTIITMVIQSSSAAMAITLILCNQGYISFEMAAGMVLGENIGTTITANLAALIGNTDAKRAALTHSMFNVFGVIWMVILFTPFLMLVEWFMKIVTEFNDPFQDPKGRIIALSIYHTAFNLLNTLVLVWVAKPLTSLAEKIYKKRKDEDELYHLSYIQTGVMSTPEIGILEAQREVAKFGEVTSRMAGFTKKLLSEQDKNERQKLFARIKKYEEITDRIEIEIGDYLSKISEEDLSDTSSKHVRSMLSINNDLERIGDIFFQISKSLERKENDRIWFTPEQRNNLLQLFSLIDEAFVVMNENLTKEYLKSDLNKAIACEQKINEMRNSLRSSHLENIEKQEYSIKSGMIYSDLFSSLEKVGDHIINVSEATAGKM